MPNTRIIQFGLGTIGSEIAKLILERGMEITGAVDTDPEKAGKDLGEVLGRERLGVRVSHCLDDVLSSDADIVVNSTISSLEKLEPDIVRVLEAKKNFISTCEELAYPLVHHPAIANRIDKLAKENGVTVLGTGVNPGFVMDRLVLITAGVCKNIRKIKATRIVDTSKRRLPLQKKTGAGMTLDEFNKNLEEKKVRHVGLLESLRIVADGLGIELDETKETTEPVIAERNVESQHMKVEKGMVSGIKQTALGIKNGEAVITLELQMCLGAEAYDSIQIDGAPDINLKIIDGIHGDLATCLLYTSPSPRD